MTVLVAGVFTVNLALSVIRSLMRLGLPHRPDRSEMTQVERAAWFDDWLAVDVSLILLQLGTAVMCGFVAAIPANPRWVRTTLWLSCIAGLVLAYSL